MSPAWIAILDILNRIASGQHQNSPAWIDAHEASIPEELLMLLARVVQEPRLMNLKGIALEVDNKQISLICGEMKTVIEILEPISNLHTRVSAPATAFQGEAVSQVENFELSRENPSYPNPPIPDLYGIGQKSVEFSA